MRYEAQCGPDNTSGLAQLCGAIANCTICRDTPSAAALPHAPLPIFRLSTRASILIASQAPGARAHASGVPFDDASGRRLRAWLGVTPEIFYDVDRFAILPMGFCFPGYDRHGGDLPPRPECRARWHDEVMAQMPSVELILMIGRFAQGYHLRRACKTKMIKASLSQTVRDWRTLALQTSPSLFPLPHPSWRNTAWLRNNSWFEAEVIPDLQARVQRLVI